jgi:hypothetical protein
LSLGQEVLVEDFRSGIKTFTACATGFPDPALLESVASCLPEMVVLHSGDEVQKHVLCINGWDFESVHYLGVALTQPGRLFYKSLSHSRVVRCDFIES